MKQLAILEYEILFDPSESWSSGYQFENQFADFFAAHGFEAQIIEARGGTGRRVIFLNRINNIASNVPQPKASKPVGDQIKQVQQRTPPRDFKRFPKPRNTQLTPPKLGFSQPGQSNRQKVRY